MMLVVLEGIDAAGKTTLSRMLAADLRRQGVNARVFDKRALPAALSNNSAALNLNRLIWPPEDAGEDGLGALPRLHLLAAWYAAISRYVAACEGGPVYVADGWYFRNLVKTEIRTSIPADALASLFQFAAQPDMVVLLDASPVAAWGRRTDWKSWELGRWDGQCGPDDRAFINYQSAVRKSLQALAERCAWLRIEEPIKLTEASQVLTSAILQGLRRRSRHPALSSTFGSPPP